MQATQKIEGYDSFEQVALGGMAAVYKARKISLGKPVAIKVLFPHLAQDAVYIERFKREAQTAARVQHDNIVNVIDYGESEGSHYIVMEYYDGVTLEHLLEEHANIPIDICFAVVLNVCYGLEAAHAANLVHRDIKPGNVIFTRSGGLKVADFGLAKAVDRLAPVTQHGKVIGTPAYMSPEQTRGDDVGTQSDIFSLGVVAYELICSHRPFDGRSYAEVVDKIQSADPTPVADINPLIDESFAKIVSRMLAKDGEDRYQHVSEVVMDLEEAIDKARFKRDRRVLEGYINDPAAYLKKFNGSLLKKLRSKDATNGAAEAPVTHLRRILYLDPFDEDAQAALARLNSGTPGGASAAAPEDGVGAVKQRRQKEWTIDEETEGTPTGGAAAEVCDDPDADYQVYLESIDLNQETPATFALKLSMRIRSPLPRIMAIVKNMPAVVGGRLRRDKALRLAKVIGDLGGVARIEVHDIDGSSARATPSSTQPKAGERSSSQPPAKRKRKSKTRPAPAHAEGDPAPGAPASPDSPDCAAAGHRTDEIDKTVEHHPIGQKNAEQRPVPQRMATRLCPKCGWEEDADAKFCSICMCNFHKTEPLTLEGLQSRMENANPLASEAKNSRIPTNLTDMIQELPNNVKYGGLAALIVLLLLIIFGR